MTDLPTSNTGLPTSYQQLIHMSRYSRWLPKEGRRETWEETVARYIDFFKGKFPQVKEEVWGELQESILVNEVCPSMRVLMTAGPALERDNVAGYNCAYLHMNRQRSFDETLYVLMCGTGVGYSVESKFTEKLPKIPGAFHETPTTIHVRDSKIGWAVSTRELISLLYSGQIPKWDVSKIRKEGSPLKIFGGRASGPDPLVKLFKFLVNTFQRAKGRKLLPIEVHDIQCKIAEIVVVGGVRRSALISLSDIDDPYMPKAKSPVPVMEYTLLGHEGEDRKYSVNVDDAPYGVRSLIVTLGDWESGTLQKDKTLGWWHVHPERALANNSVAYLEKPNAGVFIKEWSALYESKSGERGIFSREAAKAVIDREGRRDSNFDFGCNPCSEILLRDRQFCNLSEVVLRYDDSLEAIERKVRLATIFGTLQSSLTNFRYLSPKWEDNTKEERLLGVSLTGIEDNTFMNGNEDYYVSGRIYHPKKLEEILEGLKEIAIETNKKWAKKLGLNQSTAITCVKPSGTVSQLVNSSSGIHPRYSQYYIRRIRNDIKDPVSNLLKDQGIPWEMDKVTSNTIIFSFRQKSPEGSTMRHDRSALQMLELWKVYATHWCEHKPSITVYVKEEEWWKVRYWVYNNFDIMSGVSFLPFDNGTYQQAPYEEMTKEEYEKFPEIEIDWSKLSEYEREDMTVGSQELACSGSSSCEI